MRSDASLYTVVSRERNVSSTAVRITLFYSAMEDISAFSHLFIYTTHAITLKRFSIIALHLKSYRIVNKFKILKWTDTAGKLSILNTKYEKVRSLDESVESFPVLEYLSIKSSTVNMLRCTGAYVVIHLSTDTVRELMMSAT
jgi:hypothetical protein